MDTQNIKITNQGWQDLITLGELELTSGDTCTIACRGEGTCEVVLADAEPKSNFLGHIVSADENFNFNYDGTKIWIKCGSPVIAVIS